MTVEEKQSLLTELTGQHLTQYAVKLKYPLEIQELFAFDSDTWTRKNKNAVDILQTHLDARTAKADNRTPYQLAKETALSWLIEDLWRRWLEGQGFSVKLSGCDGTRDFTLVTRTKSRPDLEISKGGKTWYVEITVNWGTYIADNNKQTLRQRKLENLQAYDGILLTTDLHGQRYFVAKAKDLFALPSPFGKYGKMESVIDLSHAIVRHDADGGLQVLPVTWRPIPGGFWRV
jgi:hypothetical protein